MLSEANSGFKRHGWPNALLDPHGRRSAAGQVDDNINRLFDLAHKREEIRRVLNGTTVLRVPGMQVNDSRSCVRCGNGRFSDLLRRQWQIRRHRWRVNRAGNGTGDDRFLVDFGRHCFSLMKPMRDSDNDESESIERL